MEEIVCYLLEIKLEVILQEICENNRSISPNSSSWKDSFSEKLISFNKHKFSSGHLKKTDPSHWTTSDGQSINSMNSILIPESYSTCIDWKIEINHPILTDIEGWQYNKDFMINGWSITPTYESQVRHRKWQRLLVKTKDIKIAKQRAQEFTSRRREYRSFNPQLISCAIKQVDYQFQYILECQRLALPPSTNNSRTSSVTSSDNPTYYSENGRSNSTSRPSTFNYSELNLLSTDPSQWSIVSPTIYSSHLIGSIDPTTLPVTHLVDAYPFLYSNPNGINSLHEFIYLIYPNKDSMGWEYNIDFEQSLNWVSSPQPTRFVRRRVWFRTLVPLNSLYQCRQSLSSYIQLHPRGLCHQGLLQRLSQFRKRWTQGIARVSNSSLSIELENNYQKNYTFSLQNCEVQPLDSDLELQKYTQSSTPGNTITNLPDWNELSGSGSGSGGGSTRTNLFCLCSINSSGQYVGIQAIFNALTPYERTQWIMILSHQIALYNISFWPLKSSPPLVDTIIFQGELYKLGHVVQNWKLRKFELTQKGILSYYKGIELKGRIRLRGCHIEWNQVTTGVRNEVKIKKLNGYQLVLRGKSVYEMNQWMNEIRPFTGMDIDEKVLFPSLVINKHRTSSDPLISYDETSLPSPPKFTSQSSIVGRHHSLSYLPTDQIKYVEEEEEKQQPQQVEVEVEAKEDVLQHQLMPSAQFPPISHTSLMELFPEEEPPLTYPPQTVYAPPPLLQTIPVVQQYNNSNVNLILEGKKSSTSDYEEEDEEQVKEQDENLVILSSQEKVVTNSTQVEEISNESAHFAQDSSENILKLSIQSENNQELNQNELINPNDQNNLQFLKSEEKTEFEVINIDDEDKETKFSLENNNSIPINLSLDINNNDVNNINVNYTNDHQIDDNEAKTQIDSRRPFETQPNTFDQPLTESLPVSNSENYNENNQGRLERIELEEHENSHGLPTTSTPNSQTHEIIKDRQGRRVSLLNINVVDSAQENAIWGGNDSDESDDNETRSSSFADDWNAGNSRPLSVKSKKSPSGPLLNIETTHEVIKDQYGRRVSVLNTNIINSIEQNIIWGGNDSDEESDNDSSSRTSSFSDHWNTGNSRPFSFRTDPAYQNSFTTQPAPLPSSYSQPTLTTSPPPTTTSSNQEVQSETKTFSSYFGFGKNRRKSL